MSEFQSQCGCKIHVTQRSSKRKIASVKYCPKHSGDALDKIASIMESVDQRCTAAGGPISATKDEITTEELRRIYKLATGGKR